MAIHLSHQILPRPFPSAKLSGMDIALSTDWLFWFAVLIALVLVIPLSFKLFKPQK